LEELPTQVKGFVAAVWGQMREYAERLSAPSLWLVQEGLSFEEPIDEALEYLEDKGKVYLEEKESYDGYLFYKIRFLEV
ncbi:MAG: hypothetical protein GXO03_05530, partial [Aquificae bacterium]|nr:hypothetical protein [Aquificota bacterium]